MTTPEFCSTIGVTFDHSGDDHKSNVVLLQNDSQMAFSSHVNVGQAYNYNVVNDYGQPRDYNAVISGDNGIIRRTRAAQNELQSTSLKQGTAHRRIRLSKITHGSNGTVKDGSCAQKQHNSKPIIAVVRSLFIFL